MKAQASLQAGQYLLAEAAQKVVQKVAEAAPGSVDAPAWAIPVGAIVVTVALSASALLLKPGVEASEKMQARDKKKWNKYD
ncbi:hypothetical protein WJX72_001278 [[Myrmecia] bisecta]|uniref:Uncharacterized protein n=1 Tax=[Myrmecia] bisecta TaxID=41462 RepID=A0AAW1PDB3_9CHLO